MDLSVIIISYNTRDITRRCLEALFAALGEVKAEVFVVDNASADGSAEMIAADYPVARLIRNDKNRGFGAANNQAIAITSAPAILLLNSDAFMHPGAIQTLLRTLAQHPEAGIAAPKLLNADGSLQPSVWPFPSPVRAWVEALCLSGLFYWTWHYRDWHRWDHATAAQVPWAIGACLLVRREIIDRIGGFDEDFFLYGEETDLERRASSAGWSVRFEPTAIVTHLGGSSGARQADAVFEEFSRASERYIRKHHGKFGLWVYRAAATVGAGLRVASFILLRVIRPSPRHADRLSLWKRVFCWSIGCRLKGIND